MAVSYLLVGNDFKVCSFAGEQFVYGVQPGPKVVSIEDLEFLDGFEFIHMIFRHLRHNTRAALKGDYAILLHHNYFLS